MALLPFGSPPSKKLVAGTGISLTPSGSSITIANTGSNGFPRVSAQYYASVNQTVTANATPINFDTLTVDNTSSVTTGSGWKFTAPSAGDYLIQVTLDLMSTSASVYVLKNGTAGLGYLFTSAVSGGIESASAIVTLALSDYIQVYSDTTVVVHGGAGSPAGNFSYIGIQRIS